MLKPVKADQNDIENAGLEYRLYLPEEGDLPRPAVIMVHGRAGYDSLMWVFSKTFQGYGLSAFAPQAPEKDPIGGFSWWQVGTESAASGDHIPALEKLDSFVSFLIDEYNLDL